VLACGADPLPSIDRIRASAIIFGWVLHSGSFGMSADESVHSLIDAIYTKMPYTEFQRHVRIHPTVSELLPTVLEHLTVLP